jgi:hypothetical protein
MLSHKFDYQLLVEEEPTVQEMVCIGDDQTFSMLWREQLGLPVAMLC